MKTFTKTKEDIGKKSRKTFNITFVITVSVLIILLIILNITNKIKYNISTVSVCGFIILIGLVVSYKISGVIGSFSDKLKNRIGLVLFFIFPLADILLISHVYNHYLLSNVQIIMITYLILFLIFR